MTKRIDVGRTVQPTSSPTIVSSPASPRVRVLTRATTIISDAFEVVAHEISLARKTMVEHPDVAMSDTQAKTFGRHVRALVLLSGEQREVRKIDDVLSRLSDEQLIALARTALEQLKDGGD